VDRGKPDISNKISSSYFGRSSFTTLTFSSVVELSLPEPRHVIFLSILPLLPDRDFAFPDKLSSPEVNKPPVGSHLPG
jgi:hypothetical protein